MTILETLAQRQADLLDRYEHGEEARDLAANAKNAEVDAFLNQAGLALKQSSGGALVCLKTTGGQDSWFYGFGKVSWLDLRPDGVLGTATDIHEAFLVNGVEKEVVFIAAFPLALKNGEVVSQPGLMPYTSRSYAEDLEACANTQIAGYPDAHRLMSNWDWSLVYHSMIANQYQPIGNTSYGNSHEKTHISGQGLVKTKTGSLGDLSSHTGTSQGVFDLVGNVWERVSGMETRDGEVFVSADNGNATNSANYVSTGHYYSGSNADGNGTPSIITDPANISRNGTAGDNSNGSYDYRGGASGFATLAGDSSTLMKRACLAPIGDGTDGNGAFYVRNYGTRIPLRGGSSNYGANAGIGVLNLTSASVYRHGSLGFRSAFVI